MPRPKPAPSDLDDINDHADELSVQRIVPANSAPRPVSTAPISVFDAGRMAKAAARPPLLTAADITIRKGVPKPLARAGAASAYRDVLRNMQPGDSVELPEKRANSFYAEAMRFGKKAVPEQRHSYRKVNPTHGAIWRDR